MVRVLYLEREEDEGERCLRERERESTVLAVTV